MKIIDTVKEYVGILNREAVYFTSPTVGITSLWRPAMKVDNASPTLQTWIEMTTGKKYIRLLEYGVFVDEEDNVLKPPFQIVKNEKYDFENIPQTSATFANDKIQGILVGGDLHVLEATSHSSYFLKFVEEKKGVSYFCACHFGITEEVRDIVKQAKSHGGVERVILRLRDRVETEVEDIPISDVEKHQGCMWNNHIVMKHAN